MNTRWLGIIFMASTLGVLLNSYRSDGQVGDTLNGLAYVAWGVGGFCAVVGLIRLNALGTSPVARALGFLPAIGFALLALTDGLRLAGLISVDLTLFVVLASIAWISMLAGMLLVGILTIAAKTWRGWQRFVPLLAVVMLPIGQGIGSALGIGAIIAYAFWLLLGYTIAVAEPAPALQASAVA